MRILSIDQHYQVIGGKERYTFELADLLTSHLHQVIPFAFQEPGNLPSPYERFFPPKPQNRGAFSLRLLIESSMRLYNLAARRAIRNLLDTYSFDIAHIHSRTHFSRAVFDELIVRNIPIIYTLHDYYQICPVGILFNHDSPCEQCNGQKYHRAVVNRCSQNRMANSIINALDSAIFDQQHMVDKVSRFICPSEFSKDTHTRFGLPSDKLAVLPYFAPVHKWQSSPLPTNGSIIFAGRLFRQKGVHILLDGLAMLKLPSSVRVVIVGTGPEEMKLRKQCRVLNLTNVQFIEHQDYEALHQLYTQSQFAVVPSIWYEVLGFAALEPLAVGRPVLATRIGGLPEVVSHDVNGLLCNPADVQSMATGIETMLQSTQRLTEMGHAGRERMERFFSPGVHYQKLMEIYTDAITDHHH